MQIKDHFPILQQVDGEGRKLTYLDSAATSQKPTVVVDRLRRFYEVENSNVHRGVYRLSEEATMAYENARRSLAGFLGAGHAEEIVFTRGTTESINLVTSGWGEKFLKPGDEILLTMAEHHSNIVPWHMIAQKTGAKVVFAPLDEEFRLDMGQFQKLLSSKTKMVAIAHVSNVLGCVHPIREIVKMAKSVGAKTLIDGAQGVAHMTVNVEEIGCDFYTLSGHKVMGPMGVGALYGKRELLDDMLPYQGGGEMIGSVTLDGFTCNQVPSKFEAGTPNVGGAVGLEAAVKFLGDLPRDELNSRDKQLGTQVVEGLRARKNYQVFCSKVDDWVGTVTFSHSSIHPHDIASIADTFHVCIRAGHHCAQPLMSHLKVPATCRVSPYYYNDESDIDRFFEAMDKVESLFA